MAISFGKFIHRLYEKCDDDVEISFFNSSRLIYNDWATVRKKEGTGEILYRYHDDESGKFSEWPSPITGFVVDSIDHVGMVSDGTVHIRLSYEGGNI